MFEPKYLIRLDTQAFPSEQAVCLGAQLKSIVKNIDEFIEPPIWFCADIDASSPIPKRKGIDSFQLKKIGDSHSLIDLCENIDQFLSGVFIAVKAKNQNLKYPDLRVGTEDALFRSLDLDGVLIEIRAFDTSYFELYSDDLVIMKKLSKIYNINISTFQL